MHALPPPGTFGLYRPVALIGRGGMGLVYRVRHEQIGVEYALKVIRADVLGDDVPARFEREMRLLASLDHPSLVRVHASGRTPAGEPYYVMDLLEGRTLANLVDEEGPLEPRHAARLIAPVARAVHAAHGQGVIHRDLKPENVLVLPGGEVKLLDFGLALADRRDYERLTRSNEILGTPSFMAPEQVDGTSPVTAASDVWSLGVVLFNLVTGRLPYEGAGTYAVLRAILTQEPPLPSRFEERAAVVDEVFLRCCERAPARRYGTAAELADDLEALARGEPPLAEGRVLARARAERKRTLALAAGVFLALVLVGVGIGVVRSAPSTPTGPSADVAAQIRTATARLSAAGFDPLAVDPADEAHLARARAYASACRDLDVLRERVPAPPPPPPAATRALAEALAGGTHGLDERLARLGSEVPVELARARLAVAARDGKGALARIAAARPRAASPAENTAIDACEVRARLLLAAGGPPEERAEHVLAALERGAAPAQIDAAARRELELALRTSEATIHAGLVRLARSLAADEGALRAAGALLARAAKPARALGLRTDPLYVDAATEVLAGGLGAKGRAATRLNGLAALVELGRSHSLEGPDVAERAFVAAQALVVPGDDAERIDIARNRVLLAVTARGAAEALALARELFAGADGTVDAWVAQLFIGVARAERLEPDRYRACADAAANQLKTLATAETDASIVTAETMLVAALVELAADDERARGVLPALETALGDARVRGDLRRFGARRAARRARDLGDVAAALRLEAIAEAPPKGR